MKQFFIYDKYITLKVVNKIEVYDLYRHIKNITYLKELIYSAFSAQKYFQTSKTYRLNNNKKNCHHFNLTKTQKN